MKYRTKLCLAALMGSILSAGCFLYSIKNVESVDALQRPESGSGDSEALLQLELQGETYPFEIVLQEVPYEESEIQSMLDSASTGLEKLFLNLNADLHDIRTNVSMPSVYPDTSIAIQWHMDSWEYIEPDGTVKNEQLTEEVFGKVQAVLMLEDQSITWERDLTICPPQTLSAEQRIRVLEEQLREKQKGAQSAELVLPKQILGQPISWYERADDRWMWMLALTALALCALAAGHRKDEEDQLRKRERSMELDYAEIVSRLSLYMGAGISTRKAWERIVENYEEKNREKKEYHDAYEEMRTTLHEMQSGVPEALAYERFGTRCRMPAYLKLGTLLSQNLRRGTKNLSELLQEESVEAFENRKALAKKMGEECESKLLFPMLLMLLTVLIMVMYPAMISFQV